MRTKNFRSTPAPRHPLSAMPLDELLNPVDLELFNQVARAFMTAQIEFTQAVKQGRSPPSPPDSELFYSMPPDFRESANGRGIMAAGLELRRLGVSDRAAQPYITRALTFPHILQEADRFGDLMTGWNGELAITTPILVGAAAAKLNRTGIRFEFDLDDVELKARQWISEHPSWSKEADFPEQAEPAERRPTDRHS